MRLLPSLVTFPYLFIVNVGLAQITSPAAPQKQADPDLPLAKETEDGFLVPHPHPKFEFPRDHGSHPDFKIEWWYLTGHLFGPQNERFGYQATFFRRSGPKTPASSSHSERFRTDEIHLFHAALLEERTGTFLHQEQLLRTGWNAQSSATKLSVQIGDASLRASETDHELFQLESHIRDAAHFNLQLRPTKPLVVFGKDGISRKGDSPTAASWYLTFSRLNTEGSLRIGSRTIPVHGETWMDHEISSSQLTGEQSGWDWAGIQFEDGREIMTYRLRRKDGSTDPASSLSWVSADGKTTQYSAQEFRWEADGKWKSPHTSAQYPLPVRLTCTDPATGTPVEFLLKPIALDQELGGSKSGLAYWEGACRVLRDGKVVGSAYVELTGYSNDLSERLK